MKTFKKTTILLFLLSFISISAYAWGGKKKPPLLLNVKEVQLHLTDMLK